MATSISKLAVQLGLNAEGVKVGVNQAEGALSKLNKRVKDLNKGFGDSGAAATVGFLKGAGAAAAFQLAGQALNKTFDEVSEAIDRVTSGTVSTGEAVADVALNVGKSLPVVGEFVKAGEKLGNWVTGVSSIEAATKKMNDEIERSKKVFAELGKVSETVNGKINAAVRERIMFFAKDEDKPQIKAQFEVEDAQAQIAKLRKELASIPVNTKAEEERRNGIIKEIELYEHLASQVLSFAAAEQAAAKSRVGGAAAEKLNEQIALYGKSSQEIELIKLGWAGVNKESIKYIASLQNTLIEMEKMKAAKTAGDDAVTQLTQEVDLFGKSAEEVKRIKLSWKGVSEETLNQVEHLQSTLAGMKKAKEDADELAKSLKEIDAKQMEDWKSKAQQVFEDTRTEAEKLKKELEDLFELHKMGMIDDESFRRARGSIYSKQDALGASGEFEQVVLSRINLAGSNGRAGKTPIETDAETKNLLRSIERNTSKPRPATAA